MTDHPRTRTAAPPPPPPRRPRVGIALPDDQEWTRRYDDLDRKLAAALERNQTILAWLTEQLKRDQP